MHTLSDKKKRILSRVIVLVFFIAVLITGINIYKDYGVSVDEPMQRRHSLVNYEYINEKLLGRDVPYVRERGYDKLENYNARQYGVALQLPMVLAEDINDFEMTDFEIYQMRHLFNFMVYFCGLVALFFIIKDLTKSDFAALAGTAMFYLFPHFFASSYYNVKDMLFIPMFIISCLFMLKLLRTRKAGYIVLFALFTALATNIRILGIMTVPAALVCMLAEDVLARSKRTELRELIPHAGQRKFIFTLLPYILLPLLTLGFMLLIAPASWDDPAGYLKLVVGRSLDYEVWTRTMMFMGKPISYDAIPWYYLPVWMGITVPLFDIAMFFAGAFFIIAPLFKNGRLASFIRDRYLWMFLLFFLLPFLVQIMGSIKIYLGWRHMYMLMVPLCVISAYGLQRLHKRLSGGKAQALKWVIPIITIAALIAGTVRVAVNHPFQYSLFNAIGAPIGEGFDRDYYRMSAKQALEYILERKPEGKVTVKSNYSLNTPRMGIPAEEAERITLRGGELPAEYYIELYRDTPGNTPNAPGYTEIYAIWQDGYKIASVLLNDFLYEYEKTGVMRIPLQYFFGTNDNYYAPQHRNVRSSKGIEGYFMFGPYLHLAAGEYVLDMDFVLKAAPGSAEQVGIVDIAGKSGTQTYGGVQLFADSFTDGKYHLTMPFTLEEDVYDLEIRVFANKGVWLQAADNVLVSRALG